MQNMTALDLIVIAGVMTLFVSMAVMANRLTKSVSDYLVAGRSAGRYMLTIASGSEWIGAINIVAMFQIYYTTGFPAMWWVMLTTLFAVYMNISGFGVYRFRETRALTIAQFLEIRYDRPVRVLAGVISWCAGMINFGYFPYVSANLFMTLFGFPETVTVAGVEVRTLFVLIGLMVLIPLFFVITGGHTTVIVSDFMQGLFTNVAAVLIVAVVMFTVFDWGAITECLLRMPGANKTSSMLNPLHSSGAEFNVWYFLIGIAGMWYTVMSNTPSQAFLGAGKNAHELRMGNLLGQMRWHGLLVFFMALTLVAFQYMHHPANGKQRSAVTARLEAIPIEAPKNGAPKLDETQQYLWSGVEMNEARKQAIVPAALPSMLPAGMVGLFCAIMIAALINSHNSFMHAWGGVLLQDIIMPFRRKPFSPKTHIWLLRASIVFIGVVIFLFSLILRPQQNILQYFALVNNIWLGPSGAVMLGGLYWKRGTARAAITTLILGTLLGLCFFGAEIYCSNRLGHSFPIPGQWVFLITIVASVAIFAAVSIFDSKHAFNMDKMLRRGQYAVAGEQIREHRATAWWQRLLGITPMFNTHDRITAVGIVGYFAFWTVVFFVGTIYGSLANPSQEAWAKFWHVYIYIVFIALMISTVWLAIGGMRDLGRLIRGLRGGERDHTDDGWVRHEEYENGK